MKKLLFVLLASITPLLHAQEFYTSDQLGIVQQRIDEWYAHHVQQLSFEDVQVLANFINSSELAAHLDCKTKRLYIKMQSAFQALQKNMVDESDNTDTNCLAFLNTSMPIANKLLNARTIIFKRWYACTTWMSEHASPELRNTLDPMQAHLQHEVIAFLENNKTTFNTVAEQEHDAAKQSSQWSQSIANTYQALLDGNSPITADQPEFQSIVDLEAAVQLGKAFEKQSWQNLNTSTTILELSLLTQDLSSLLYSLYYKTLYTENLMSMFDGNGLIPEDRRVTPLPKPE